MFLHVPCPNKRKHRESCIPFLPTFLADHEVQSCQVHQQFPLNLCHQVLLYCPERPFLIMVDDNQESLSRAAMRRQKAYLVSNLPKASCRTLDAFHSLTTDSCRDTAMETAPKTNSHTHTQTHLNPTASFLSLFSLESSASLRREKSNLSVYDARHSCRC